MLWKMCAGLVVLLAAGAAVAVPSVPVGAGAGSSSSSSSCPDVSPDFTDTCYHEYVLYNVDQAEVDVVILPSASPYPLRDSIILEESANAWESGIDALAPSWLASGLNLHVYSLGFDPVPASALWDPEVIIVPAEVNYALLAGIGLQVPASFCHGIPSPLSAKAIAGQPGFHAHDGSDWGVLTVECEHGGRTCIVVNTNFLWLPDNANRRDMYDLNSHELGHCLGIGHVGDALDFAAAAYPEDDIMSYENDGHDAFHVLCVSTLNILALEQVYGHLLGQAGYPVSPAGTYVHMPAGDWSAVSCPEPTASYTDLTPVLTADPLGGIIP